MPHVSPLTLELLVRQLGHALARRRPHRPRHRRRRRRRPSVTTTTAALLLLLLLLLLLASRRAPRSPGRHRPRADGALALRKADALHAGVAPRVQRRGDALLVRAQAPALLPARRLEQAVPHVVLGQRRLAAGRPVLRGGEGLLGRLPLALKERLGGRQ